MSKGEQAWPAMSLAEATARLTQPGAPFEMETVLIDGREVLSWKNQAPTLPEFARRVRTAYADREFVVYEDDRMTYEGWFRAVSALSRKLIEAGLRPGDRVALAMRNLPEWPAAFFAVHAAGAIAVPLNAWWTGPELAYALDHSQASVLVTDYARMRAILPHLDELPALREVWVTRSSGRPVDGRARALEDVIGEVRDYSALPDQSLPELACEPDDPATIFYTSGTTGKPKGALGTHRNMLTCSLASAFSVYRTALRRGEQPPAPKPKIGLLVIPLFHVTACNSSLMSTMQTGSKLVTMRKWDAGQALALIEREKVSTTGGVPTIACQILEHPDRDKYDLSSLELVTYGGAPAAPDLVSRLGSDLRVSPGSGWGMTETSATVTLHGGEDYLNRPDSCGPPLPVSRLKIMDPEGECELPVGEVGELWAYGPQIVKGYWRDPEATAKTFVDGWVRTGDLARLDEEGFCYIVDRMKDIVIRGGENIYSIEVECALQDHPAVIDAGVVGIPHRVLGEEPAAVVQLASGESASEAELQQWVRERLAAYKVPVRIAFSSLPLPRNANGKVMKAELRSMLA